MLRSLKTLQGYNVTTLDGPLGTVVDFYLGDVSLAVRYVVVDTGKLFSGRKVLLSPTALGEPDWATKALPVNHTREQVRTSPSIDLHKPVSRLQEEALHKHYAWTAYWAPSVPVGVSAPGEEKTPSKEDEVKSNLRSLSEVIGYKVGSLDGEAGTLDDFIVDDEQWVLRMLVVNTGGPVLAKPVVLTIRWVGRFSWDESTVFIDKQREDVAEAPTFDPTEPINEEVETRFYDYFGRLAGKI